MVCHRLSSSLKWVTLYYFAEDLALAGRHTDTEIKTIPASLRDTMEGHKLCRIDFQPADITAGDVAGTQLLQRTSQTGDRAVTRWLCRWNQRLLFKHRAFSRVRR